LVTKEAVKNFPDSPGVYLMKDNGGEVIYVGKAVSLKKRVLSYLLKDQASIKTQGMLGFAARIEYIPTASEYDALILESNLIKRYRPRFNIALKDDKSFPYIKITKEEFPRVFIGRRKKGEEGFDSLTEPRINFRRISVPRPESRGVDYFGPYTSAKLLRKAVEILRKSFPFCSCRRFPKRPCLNYDLKLCPGPCQGKISRKKYQEIIRDLENFLMKKDAELIDELSSRMRERVRQEKFEEAAKLRDQLEALSLLISLKKFDSRKFLDVDTDFKRLGMLREPQRIEAFDISNISGNQAVGSMVSFYHGKADKNNYRRFRIRTVSGVDDYAMIQEVVGRRYGRLLAERQKFPDLILIDGGAGHLSAAVEVLHRLKLKVPIIAIAKNEELIYTVNHKNPIRLSRDSAALQLVQRVRDEAHRFALKYHRFLRHKNAFMES
jgi:excinuclease ABC subunit C